MKFSNKYAILRQKKLNTRILFSTYLSAMITKQLSWGHLNSFRITSVRSKNRLKSGYFMIAPPVNSVTKENNKENPGHHSDAKISGDATDSWAIIIYEIFK